MFSDIQRIMPPTGLARRCSAFLQTVAALLVAALVFGSTSATANDHAPPPSEDQLRQWVQDLASPQFTVREQAQKQLTEAGFRAERVLHEILDSEDVEQQAFAARRIEELDTERNRLILNLRHRQYFSRFTQQGGSIEWRVSADSGRFWRYSGLLVSPETGAIYTLEGNTAEARAIADGRVRWSTEEEEEGRGIIRRMAHSDGEAWLLRDRIIFNHHIDWNTSVPSVMSLADGKVEPIKLPEGFSGRIHAVFDHRIIMTDQEGSTFIAIHVVTGKKLWKAELNTRHHHNISLPVRIGDTMIIWVRRNIQRIDLETGKVHEARAIDRDGEPDPASGIPWSTTNRQLVSHNLAAAGNRLILMAGEHIESVDVESGKRLWHTELEPPPARPLSAWEEARLAEGEQIATRDDTRAPEHLVDPNGQWIVLARADRIVCLNLADGKVRWQVLANSILPTEITDPDSERWWWRDRGFSGQPLFCEPWALLATPVGVVALDIETGREAWRIATRRQVDRLALHDRVLYLMADSHLERQQAPPGAVSGLVAAKLPPAPSGAGE
ncbi:MAG: PQQ-binding-like beta-propeller repeat protein [Phycisphaeraceae bacterium]|nr:PQQ-binding-like beta-propeller repeat protein [Phycisphaeraceae bacterium]